MNAFMQQQYYLDCDSLRHVRMMVIYKRNAVVPNGLEYGIHQYLFLGTMIPLTQITRAVGVLRRRFHLNVVNTPFTLESLK